MTREPADETRTADEPTDDPDGYERVPIDDWTGIEQHARRLAGDGSVEASETELRIRSGSAHFGVTSDGTVDTGMPLHSFDKGDVDALYFDHDRDRIRVYGQDGLAYEFKKP